MTLAAVADKPPMSNARILILDIERLPGQFAADFWDLNDFKGRRIHPLAVTEWPRSICAAWKWYGKPRMHFAAEWGDTGRQGFLEATWQAYNDADIVVGHNLRSFDTKKLKGEWWLARMPKPRPWRTVDTLTVLRAEMGLESNTLDAVCRRYGIQAKTDRYSVEMARAACDGNRAAQRKITAYNKGDITATEGLYEALRGWDQTHPHLGLYDDDERACYACGSTNLTADTRTAKTALTAYTLYSCDDCGAWSRANVKRSIVTMRPVAR